MTLVPNPVLYEAAGRARRERFQAAAARRRPAGSVRIRIGRMLISIGTTISGDCIELRPRRRAARQPHAA